MQEGLIVYLVTKDESPPEVDPAALAQTSEFGADRVELVSREAGFFTVEDAWHFLYTRGCGRISLQVAEADKAGSLQPLGPRVRLCG